MRKREKHMRKRKKLSGVVANANYRNTKLNLRNEKIATT